MMMERDDDEWKKQMKATNEGTEQRWLKTATENGGDESNEPDAATQYVLKSSYF